MKELSVESILTVIEAKQPRSLSQLAHHLGYKGGISSSVIRKLKQLVPDIAELLAKGDQQATPPKSPKTAKPAQPMKPLKATAKKIADKATKKAVTAKAKPMSAKDGKWPRDPRNPFREGSAYATCFNILAAPAHREGLLKEKLIQLLAEATGKDVKHAGFDAQVLLSAHPADEIGLSNNDSPRHRSCRPGFFVKRANGGHVQLMVDKPA